MITKISISDQRGFGIDNPTAHPHVRHTKVEEVGGVDERIAREVKRAGEELATVLGCLGGEGRVRDGVGVAGNKGPILLCVGGAGDVVVEQTAA